MKGSIPATQLCVCVYVSQLVSESVCVHVCEWVCACQLPWLQRDQYDKWLPFPQTSLHSRASARSVSLDTLTNPPARLRSHTHKQTKTNHPHAWPTHLKANVKMKNYRFMNSKNIWASYRQKFCDSELKLVYYRFYSYNNNDSAGEDHKVSIWPLVCIDICVNWHIQKENNTIKLMHRSIFTPLTLYIICYFFSQSISLNC